MEFPRIMYRGEPDVLGRGPHPHPQTGDLVGEAKRVEAHEYDDHVAAGWRLTRHIPAEEAAEAGDADVDQDDADDEAGEDVGDGAGSELEPVKPAKPAKKTKAKK